ADHARAQDQYVHVVMFHALVRGVTVMAKTGANAGNLVGGDGCAHAAAANQNAAFTLAAKQAERNRFGEVRITNRLGAIGAGVQTLMPALPQMANQQLLQVEAGVSGSDGDAHVNSSFGPATPGPRPEPRLQ